MTARLIHADCIEAMREMDEASVDAIVTDPPYHLTFMAKAWDRPDDHKPWAVEALRVLKPGGHLLAFGGTRTYHRLACAIEDAGFEIRDCIAWMYGSGFPKSLDVSKAIDKAAGAEREVVGPATRHAGQSYQWAGEVRHPTHSEDKAALTAPATPDAERWQGWGTALKPAFEPIVVARKPLAERNVASQVLATGTGALNIDGTRIEAGGERFGGGAKATGGFVEGYERGDGFADGSSLGRWPANVVLGHSPDCDGGSESEEDWQCAPDCAVRLLDEQTGELHAPVSNGQRTAPQASSWSLGDVEQHRTYSDTGGASRFFLVVPSEDRFRYVPKADREERERGLEHRSRRALNWSSGEQSPGTFQAEGTDRTSTNPHPTVKPVELMRWLCRLVTPPGGTVLDPFTGSGSTGIAALREGFDFIGIEREAEYVEIAQARIVGDAPLFNTVEVA
jgi:DNA modification methylase